MITTSPVRGQPEIELAAPAWQRELARAVTDPIELCQLLQLDPRLATEDLAGALRAALDSPSPGYAARAAELLAPFGRDAVDEVVVRDVLPRLLPGLS